MIRRPPRCHRRVQLGFCDGDDVVVGGRSVCRERAARKRRAGQVQVRGGRYVRTVSRALLLRLAIDGSDRYGVSGPHTHRPPCNVFLINLPRTSGLPVCTSMLPIR
jgi:hypothetical protein